MKPYPCAILVLCVCVCVCVVCVVCVCVLCVCVCVCVCVCGVCFLADPPITVWHEENNNGIVIVFLIWLIQTFLSSS